MRTIAPLLIMALLGACGDDVAVDGGPSDSGADTGVADTGLRDALSDALSDTALSDTPIVDAGDDAPLPLEFSTSAFADGEPVPIAQVCGPPLTMGDGLNVSPSLAWSGGPDAASYAVVMRDLSADGLVHWAIYDIPADLRALPEGIATGYMPVNVEGARQAEVQMVHFGYLGPCSDGSDHTYEWTLHAMPDASLPGVDDGTSATAVADLIEERSTASASFTGIY